MKQQHPITPPPELFAEWLAEAKRLHPTESTGFIAGEVARLAYQTGADQELEACLGEVSFLNSQALADRVRAARRPESSLKDRALRGLAKMIENGHLAPDLAAEIRAVLEMAPDE